MGVSDGLSCLRTCMKWGCLVIGHSTGEREIGVCVVGEKSIREFGEPIRRKFEMWGQNINFQRGLYIFHKVTANIAEEIWEIIAGCLKNSAKNRSAETKITISTGRKTASVSIEVAFMKPPPPKPLLKWLIIGFSWSFLKGGGAGRREWQQQKRRFSLDQEW